MSISPALPKPATARTTWRTPTMIVGCGCAIATIAFGPRSTLGLFLPPMTAVVRHCLLQPSGRRLPWRLARRLVYQRAGSYDAVWWLGVLFGVLSASINLPIVEKPVVRPALAPA